MGNGQPSGGDWGGKEGFRRCMAEEVCGLQMLPEQVVDG
jgi:hypothetical protein